MFNKIKKGLTIFVALGVAVTAFASPTEKTKWPVNLTIDATGIDFKNPNVTGIDCSYVERQPNGDDELSVDNSISTKQVSTYTFNYYRSNPHQDNRSNILVCGVQGEQISGGLIYFECSNFPVTETLDIGKGIASGLCKVVAL